MLGFLIEETKGLLENVVESIILELDDELSWDGGASTGNNERGTWGDCWSGEGKRQGREKKFETHIGSRTKGEGNDENRLHKWWREEEEDVDQERRCGLDEGWEDSDSGSSVYLYSSDGFGVEVQEQRWRRDK